MTHGMTIIESTSGVRPIKPASLAIIGLVATAGANGADATDALDREFPLGTQVLVSNIDAAIEFAGTTGTLAPALRAIADQVTPLIVVVRVAKGVDDAATEANVIAGLQALLSAESVVGVRPRILGAPGLDTEAVTAELVVIAKRLRAMAYARAIGNDAAEVSAYREKFGARELMLIWPDTSATVAGDIVARAMGLRARIDEQVGWHKTISNVVLDGVLGMTRNVDFDLLDPSCTAALLNDNEVTTIIRQDGYRLWGNRTCAPADQSEYAFESAVRTLHALQDEMIAIVRPFFDQPIAVSLIKDMEEAGNSRIRQLVREGRLVGARFYFPEDKNPAEVLAAGRPWFALEFTPCAPLENPRLNMVITDYYYTGFADQVAS